MSIQNSANYSTDDLFSFEEYDTFVSDRPYLSESEEEIENIFKEFDTFVSDRPYLSESGK